MPYRDDTTSLDYSLLPDDALVFTNCRLCISGQLTQPNSVLVVSKSSGKILEVLSKKPTHVSGSGGAKIIDLENKILAPGFLELQTNGMRGVHFTHYDNAKKYEQNLEEVANYLPSQGVTGFWVTIPTVKAEEFKEVSGRYS
jgi:N-acetylglucosamine-6-phosphate deacetylase